MNRFTLRQSFFLFLAATIWGVAFVAQSVGMDYVEPFTFTAVRNMIGGTVLLPVIMVISKAKKDSDQHTTPSLPWYQNKTLLLGGICCGIIMFVASNLQQIGIQYTTVAKAGFITAMYIVIVPIFGVFLRRKVGIRVGVAVCMAVAGLYLLCMTENNFSLQIGDLLVLACAVAFSLHILVIDHFSPLVDAVKLSCIQFYTCAILSTICMFLFETPNINAILTAWMPILYAGAMSSGVAFTLQIVGQKGLNPTVASLIMSLESVISLIAGWILLGEKLTSRELLGCVVVFAAIVLVQLPTKAKQA